MDIPVGDVIRSPTPPGCVALRAEGDKMKPSAPPPWDSDRRCGASWRELMSPWPRLARPRIMSAARPLDFLPKPIPSSSLSPSSPSPPPPSDSSRLASSSDLTMVSNFAQEATRPPAPLSPGSRSKPPALEGAGRRCRQCCPWARTA